ncbi:putative acetyltransferase [Lentzea flaviverrucosa]|uniref:Putative acetyltransferase n=2 Tax=Lentzea flaviverrucosa TaxID=200379 RepID=A0A1H9R9I0_9PSEU|nr:putative acetyltransferase [Lentzea flaviverrucosa]SER69318.1 putative acetyltransferase [Lentzea flaviverrucosa]
MAAETGWRAATGLATVRLMLIRRETPADIDAIRTVTNLAFKDGPEAPLIDWLRGDEGWIPELSLVADGVLGHVVCTRGYVGEVPALGLGPIAVHPSHQRGGIGSALMHAVLGAAEARGERAVILLGDPGYYSRFGFRLASEFGITPPDPAWGPHFQARLFGDVPAGAFRYAEPFNRL